jgi:hypothetical protein
MMTPVRYSPDHTEKLPCMDSAIAASYIAIPLLVVEQKSSTFGEFATNGNSGV